MDSFNINDAKEIVVRLESGDEIIYKGKGLEKFRRLMVASPAYGEYQNVVVVEEYSDEEPNIKPQRANSKKVSSKKGPTVGPNGYHTADLDYTSSSKGRSAVDIARDMQRQAEKASGIKF